VPKPFSSRELLARLRAVLRRTQPAAGSNELVVGDLVVDVGGRTARRGAELVDLTGLEFDILVALARRPGRVVPRDALLEQAGRGDVTVSDRTVDVHVSHLRRKLGDDPRAPRLIKTVRGVGYVLARGDEA
jgi:two-component system OmpR family response regulator